jgi:hypothetical protein
MSEGHRMRRHVVDTNQITATPFLAVLVVGTTYPAASAQAEDRVAAASALFDEAKAMMDGGNFAEACPKLAESEALDPQVGTMLNLALCYEVSGKTASGCEMWRKAEAAAARKLQLEREDLARDRAAKVCARAPLIAIDVAPQAGRDRVEVRINDVRLPREQWNTPQPFDPGAYQLRADGAGLRPWSSTVVVDEQHPAVVVVPVLMQEADAPEGPPPPSLDRRDRRLMAGAWIAGGVGVAALGVGSAFGVAAVINDGAATRGNNCVRNNCNAEGGSDRQRAIGDAHVADVAFAVSAGAVATGIVLWLVGSHVQPAHGGMYVHPAISQSACALSVGEAW